MKFIMPTAMALAIGMILIACNANKDKNEQESISTLNYKTEEEKKTNAEYSPEADSTKQQQPFADKNKQPTSTQKEEKKEPFVDWEKKIIKTANLNMEVKDYNNFYSSMKEKIKTVGGYVAQEEQTQSDYKIENSIVIKVPVDQFDNAVAALTENVQRINEKKISSQDVTDEFVDTRSRIEAKKQVRQRYIDFLKDAKNMEDVLNVQSEINNVQEQIESATGRVNYLGHAAAYSTINLTYYQILNATAKDNDDNTSPSFGEKFKTAFISGWNWITDVFFALLSVWPLLLGGAGGYFMVKKIRRRYAKPA